MSTTSGTIEHTALDAEDTPDAQHEQPSREWSLMVRSALRRNRRWIAAIAPGVVYLAIRLIGLLTLVWLSQSHGEQLVDNLRAWDGEWYLEISAHGYGGVDPNMVDGYGNRSPETPLAFFPGYPVLVSLFSTVFGLSTSWAGIVVSLAAGIVGAYALERIGVQVAASRAVGLLLVALFAASPMSVVLTMAYSEALFTALAAWALVGLLERRWLLAGLCCVAAGLVRPTAVAIIAVVCLAALVALRRREDGWRPWLAAGLAPLGMLLYIGWVGWQLGSPFGYFGLQRRGWSSEFDGGVATAQFMIDTLVNNKSVLETFTVWVVVAAVVLFVLCLRARLPWQLLAFSLAVLALDLGSNGLMYSKVRLLLPAFPLLLPVAMGLANRRTTTAVCTTALLVCFGSWFGAYSLTAWQYAI